MSWNFLPSSKHTKPAAGVPIGAGGFGLIELMVSISILVIVTSIVLIRQNAFNGAILLRSQAYEIALLLREVQLSAVSAVGNEGNFRSTLGVHFDTANDSQYRVFRDANANGFYDPGEAYGEQGIIDAKFEIRDIRAVGDTIAVVDGEKQLSVVFVRPNFDARFFDEAGTELNATSVLLDVARINTTGTEVNELRTLEVTSTGQITVQ